jgi:DNA-directed RNA polymerase specialized sigma24 family protein
MQASTNRATASNGAPPDLLRAAFRDLHGPRLHGFALLVALGDRATAARLASEALAAGSARTAELRHPERAAAWLRGRVTRNAERMGRSIGRRRVAGDGAPALELLGVEAAGFAGLSALTTRERAALVADSVERLGRHDVATVVGIDGARLDRLIRRARSRYRGTVADALDDAAAVAGPTATRIRAVAARALS